MGSFPIERVTHSMKFPQATQWISHLQQRPIHIMSQAPKNIIGRRLQVNHLAARVQVLAVGGAQYRATARGQYSLGTLRQLIDHRLFDITKTLFAFTFEILTDGTGQTLLYDVI